MNIWVPKVKIIEAPTLLAGVGSVRGFFVMEACNRYGQVRRTTGEWKQLITDLGMDALIANLANPSWCSVGTGSPTFTVGSSGLASFLARTNTTSSNTTIADTAGTSGYRARVSTTYEFTLGGVVGNLTEVGCFTSNNNTTGQYLDLIRDSGGSPTTFPVTADDQLRVTHIIDYYPYLGDISGSFSITGSAGSGSHDFVARCRALSDPDSRLGTYKIPSSSANQRAYQAGASLGAVSGDPTGSTISSGSPSSAGSEVIADDGTTWTSTRTWTYGLTSANHTGGIQLITWATTSHSTDPGGQIRFDPVIPKFASSIQRILTLTLRGGITRA